MLKRRKKNTRQRAGTTHGWGSMKKHRGAGHRGGRGNAGSGKRGDAKKPSYWKDTKYSGKYGFNSYANEKGASINVGHLSSSIETLATQNLVKTEGKKFVIDCNALGIEKLLGTGVVNSAMDITVDVATKKAIEKIEKAGGKVIVSKNE